MNNLYLLGDSMAKGIILDPFTHRYRRASVNLRTHLEQCQTLCVTDISRMGYTIAHGLKAIPQHISRPGYAIVEFGGNDCDFDWKSVAEHPVFEDHACHVPPKRFAELYQTVITTLRSMNVCPIIMNLPPIDPERYFTWISAGLDAKAILSFLVSPQRIYTWQEMYSHLAEQIAMKMGCPVVDIRSRFLLIRDYRDLLCEDGIHPNEKGHRLIVDQTEAFLKELLSENTHSIASSR